MNMDKYFPLGIPEEIAAMLRFTSTPITLEQIWALMDLAWEQVGASPEDAESLKRFYSHPVWVLNGIFTETHEASVNNREAFADAIACDKPKRIADYGGGFGSLSRLLARRLPATTIEIIEPYPSQLARELSAPYKNIAFVEQPTGEYDVILVIDVLEHLTKPLDFVYWLAKYVRPQGVMFFANCFYPVIRCHLQETFYLRYSFNFLMKKMGLLPSGDVLYGTKYKRIGKLNSPESMKKWIVMAKIYYEIRQIMSQLKLCIKHSIAYIKE